MSVVETLLQGSQSIAINKFRVSWMKSRSESFATSVSMLCGEFKFHVRKFQWVLLFVLLNNAWSVAQIRQVKAESKGREDVSEWRLKDVEELFVCVWSYHHCVLPDTNEWKAEWMKSYCDAEDSHPHAAMKIQLGACWLYRKCVTHSNSPIVCWTRNQSIFNATVLSLPFLHKK